jgi:GH15 family glucan-1,4-alpha-glucosidase
MACVAFDRAIKSVEQFRMKGPVEHRRAIRAEIHAEVCARGYDRKRDALVQSYEAPALDASLLLLPLVGFLPATDPRILGTVRAIQRELLTDGFVSRYRTDPRLSPDGLPPGEGVFLPCSFWLVDVYVQLGRRGDALRLFERLLELCNDVGLLSEEYDPASQRLLGNIPQAFSYLSLVNTAYNLAAHPKCPAHHRGRDEADYPVVTAGPP